MCTVGKNGIIEIKQIDCAGIGHDISESVVQVCPHGKAVTVQRNRTSELVAYIKRRKVDVFRSGVTIADGASQCAAGEIAGSKSIEISRARSAHCVAKTVIASRTNRKAATVERDRFTETVQRFQGLVDVLAAGITRTDG